MFGEEGTEGAALVEATIFVPILVAMCVYTADFGLIFYNEMEVQNIAQAGAQWAMANRIYDSAAILAAAQNAQTYCKRCRVRDLIPARHSRSRFAQASSAGVRRTPMETRS